MNLLKGRVQNNIDSLRGELLELSHFIHSHPETGLKEYQAVEHISQLLLRHGQTVQSGVCGLETAFIATRTGCGDGPHVALLAEYDALPGVGHGCGHNIIATCAAGAFLGLCGLMDGLPGRVSLIGTPAEEKFGAKSVMADRGFFRGVDFALMIHPTAGPSIIGRGSRAAVCVNVSFIGKVAHSALPLSGTNALSAAISMFDNIDRLRSVFQPGDNVNGIIVRGGEAANIIPGEAECAFSLRSNTMCQLSRLSDQVRRAAESAALLIGAEMEYTSGNVFAERYPNLPMSEAFKANMEQLGERMDYADPNGQYGSSDIGNVSILLPIIHDYLRISEEPGVNEHTEAFARDAISPRGDEICLKGAKGLAMTALELLEDPQLRSRVRSYHRENVPAEYLQP